MRQHRAGATIPVNKGAKAKASFIIAAILLLLANALGACNREVSLPVLYEAPGFTLTNQDGQEVRLTDFRGRVVVVDFFYTRCPDICSEENSRLLDVWEQLDEHLRQDFVLVSVSVDPYDTPAVLKEYSTVYKGPEWQFLTGTKEQIRYVTASYRVNFELDRESQGIAHNVVVVLIDRNGMVRKIYKDPYFPRMARDLEYLLKPGGG